MNKGILLVVVLLVFALSAITAYSIPQYSSNSTNSTLAGRPTLLSLNLTDNAGLSGYIFSFYNGANWTFNNQSSNLQSGTVQNKASGTTNNPSAVPDIFSKKAPEVSIMILNPHTSVKDNEDWIVAFNTTGIADLSINSTNANWTEFLKGNPVTSDEMQFLDIKCGENSLKDSLQLIDESNNVLNYSQLTANDSIRVKKLLVKDYNCSETGHLTNKMFKAGYATLQFTFGNQIGYAYDPSTLLVNWSIGSPINDTCTVGSPCNLFQNHIYNVNATVNCSTSPPGGNCGSVFGSLLYNSSTG